MEFTGVGAVLVYIAMLLALVLIIIQARQISRLKRAKNDAVADLVEVRTRYTGLKSAGQKIVHLLPDAAPKINSMTMDGGPMERARARAAEVHHNTQLEPVRQFVSLLKEPQTLAESRAAYKAAFGVSGAITPLPDTARELGPIKFDRP